MLSNLFEEAKKENRALLSIFVTCGDPSLDFSEKLIKTICNSGADIVELGVPFSDPMADGAVVQAASLRALDSKTTLAGVLAMAKRLRAEGIKKHFCLISYFNPILQYGIEKLADSLSDAGINSILVWDLPLEESDEIKPAMKNKGIDLIQLVAPTTPLERVSKISDYASGFLYYASGDSKSIQKLSDVSKTSTLPVGADFGIEDESLANEIAKNADAVIIGSKIVDFAYDAFEKEGEVISLKKVSELVGKFAKAMYR